MSRYDAEFWGKDKPTTRQKFWAEIFLGLFGLVQDSGRGSGRSFFWQKVATFLGNWDAHL